MADTAAEVQDTTGEDDFQPGAKLEMEDDKFGVEDFGENGQEAKPKGKDKGPFSKKQEAKPATSKKKEHSGGQVLALRGDNDVLAAANAATSTETGVGDFDPRSLFTEAPEGADGGEAEEDVTDDDTKDLSERAAKRVSGAIARAKAAETQLSGVTGELNSFKQQVTQSFNQMLGVVQHLQTENARLSGVVSAGGRPDPLAAMSPEDRTIHDLQQKLIGGAAKELDPRFAALEKKYDALFQAHQQGSRQAKSEQERSRLNQEADRALDAVLFKGFAPEAVENLRGPLGAFTMIAANSMGIKMDAAASKLKQLFNAYALAVMDARGAQNKQKVLAGQKVPAAQPTRGAAAPRAGSQSANPWPDWQKVVDAGYRTYVDWQMDGSPRL